MSKGYYKCECGKEFTEPQRFNGHKSHCKVHMQANNKLDKLIEAQDCRKETLRKTQKQKSEKLSKQKQAKQDLEKQIWIQEQHKCEKCGKIMTEKYGSGRFCSRVCSNSRPHSKETKLKISASLKATDSTFMQNRNEKHYYILDQYSHNPSICVICGKPLSYNKRNRQTCSEDCLRKLFSFKSKESVIKHNGNINPHPNKKCKTGSYKGIHFDSSWELAFIVYHIDHFIPFKRNTTGFTYIWKNCQHLYYPDFIINNEYYEIKNFWTPIVQVKFDYFPKNYSLKILYKSDMKPYLDYCIQTYGKDFYSALMKQAE